jgi:hypothetical protein
LTDLDPQWLVGVQPNGSYAIGAASLAPEQAQGVRFICPICAGNEGDETCIGHAICWFDGRGVPDGPFPSHVRWTALGASFDDLTLAPTSEIDDEHWKGSIQGGEVIS